jgi:regulator of replication initiation timing
VRGSRLQQILLVESVEPATTPGEMAMVRLGKWMVLGLAVWVLAAQEARAGIGFQPVSPDEIKMTSEPLAPGAPAIILYRQVDRDDNGHTSHEDNYIRIKVLTDEGRKHADVEIPFLKGSQSVVNVKARTIRPDGSIADFGGQVFEKYLVKGKGIKYLAKTFTLPDVQVGSIIEYSFTVDLGEYMIFDSHWILSDELFTKKAQFSLKPYKGTYVPYSLRWSWHRLPPDVAPKEGPDHIVRMEARDIPAFQTEDYMPPPNELRSRVDFIYEEGLAEKDQDSFWKKYGKQRNGQLESFIGKRKAMEEAVAQIVSPNDSQDVKLRKIYDRVQQIRNTSYEPRKTAQEQKREKEKPVENVEEIWKRGYGDGFHLTWLFLGLVRAAGFEAYGCWVSSRGAYFFDPVTMQSSKLNANAVLIKLNGKDIYLDPGAAFTPFGLLTWYETGVAGLRLDKDGGTWIQTTLPQASESRIERVGKLKLSDTGDLEGTLTVTYIGLEAMYHRMGERNEDEVARKKSLEERVTSQIAMAAEAELTNKPDWTSSETPLVAEFHLKIPGYASNAGKRVVLPAAIFTVAEKGIFEHANRVHPIYFEYPYEKADDVTIELPPGWQVSSVPATQDNNGKVVVYGLKVDKSAEGLRLTRKLTIDFLLMDQKYYGALRNFFQAVRSGDGMQIVVQPGEIHASN